MPDNEQGVTDEANELLLLQQKTNAHKTYNAQQTNENGLEKLNQLQHRTLPLSQANTQK